MTRSRLKAVALIVAALAASGPQVWAQQTPAPAAARTLPPAEEVKAIEPGQPAAQPSAQPAPNAATPADATAPSATPGTEDGPSLPSVSASRLPRDLSPIGMFLGADWVVKAVMIGLAFASVLTWTIWIAKSLELASARKKVRHGLKVLGAARTLEDARRGVGGRKASGPIATFVDAADAELAFSEDTLSPDGVKERVASHLERIEAQAGRRLTVGTGMLATIGATAPFVGLFGTVWGIMNSFIGISNAQTTNLAVVAPGIAEALLATAIGLVAAIPAVVIYNVFARQIAGCRALLADGSAATLRIVSRDLDRESAPRFVRRAAE